MTELKLYRPMLARFAAMPPAANDWTCAETYTFDRPEPLLLAAPVSKPKPRLTVV